MNRLIAGFVTLVTLGLAGAAAQPAVAQLYHVYANCRVSPCMIGVANQWYAVPRNQRWQEGWRKAQRRLQEFQGRLAQGVHFASQSALQLARHPARQDQLRLARRHRRRWWRSLGPALRWACLFGASAPPLRAAGPPQIWKLPRVGAVERQLLCRISQPAERLLLGVACALLVHIPVPPLDRRAYRQLMDEPPRCSVPTGSVGS